MKSLLNLQWRNALHNFRQKIFILLVISLSVSMVSGLGLYFDAVSENQFKKSFTYVSDFEITHYQIYTSYGLVVPRLGYSENFAPDDAKIQQLLSNSKLNFESISKYGILTCEQGFFANKNYPSMGLNSTHTILEFQKAQNSSEIKFIVFDDNFYKSNRFSQFFKIINGRTPENPNEILIDYGFSLKNSFKCGDTVNISSRIGVLMPALSEDKPPINYLNDFSVKNVKVVGIYVPTQLHYTLDRETFDYSYTYNNYLDNLPYKENQEYIDGPALFSWYNFTGPDYQHPFQLFYNDVLNGKNSDDHPTSQFLSHAYTRSGYLISYPRETISFRNLNHEQKFIKNQIQNITYTLPHDESLGDLLSLSLTQFYEHFQILRILIQILNFPLILFALMISINLNSIDKDKKISEIYLLRGRGVKKKVIKRMLIGEIFTFSLVGTIFSMTFGYLIFYLFRFLFKGIFVSSHQRLIPIFTDYNLIITFLLIGIIQLFSSRSTFRFLKKMNYHQLSNQVYLLNKHENEFDDDGESSSNIIFEKSDISNKEIKFKKNRNELKNNNNKIFQEKKEESSKKQIFWQIITIILGILPILIEIFGIVGNFINLPDTLLDIHRSIMNNIPIFEIFSIIGLIIIVYGVTTLIVSKRPKLFTLFTFGISKLITSKYSNYISSDISRKKKNSSIIIIMAIYWSLFFFSNIIYNSLAPFSIIVDPENAEFFSSGNFYMIFNKNLIIIGILLIFEISLSIIFTDRENKVKKSILKGRGFSKGDLIKIYICQFISIILIGLIIGGLIGVSFSSIFLQIKQILFVNYIDAFQGNLLHMKFDLSQILLMIGIISIGLFSITVGYYSFILFSNNRKLDLKNQDFSPKILTMQEN